MKNDLRSHSCELATVLLSDCRLLPMRRRPMIISDADMQRVYDEVKTPYKYGIVLRPADGRERRLPQRVPLRRQVVHALRRHQEQGRLRNVSGRERRLAHLEAARQECCRLRTTAGTAGRPTAALRWWIPTWGGSAELQTFDGKYWMSYFGGAKQGYETDPLSIGMAWTDDAQRAAAVDAARREPRPHARSARCPALRAGDALQEPHPLGQGRSRSAIRS